MESPERCAAACAARSSPGIRVAATRLTGGSVSTQLVGRTFEIRTGSSSGAATEISGPDWALAAWLIGRNDHARAALGELPEDLHWL